MNGIRSVILLGNTTINMVAVARSLHAKGIPVISASNRQPRFQQWSRSIQHSVMLPDPVQSPQAYREKLGEVIEVYRADTLMPLSDHALAEIAPHDEWLRERLMVACPSPATVGRVLDKMVTIELAQAHRVPVPVTCEIPDPDRSDTASGPMIYPAVAKLKDRRQARRGDVPVRHLANRSALVERQREDREFGRRYHLQAYIPGDDVGLGVLFSRGELLAAFQYRVEKMIPYFGGFPVLTCSEAVDPRLRRHATVLLHALGWEGIAQLDFRRNSATGKFTLMEINGRLWGSIAAAIHAGMDFPYWAWQLAHDEPPAVRREYPVGMRVRWLGKDLDRLGQVCRRKHGETWGFILRELARFVTDCRMSNRPGFWSWRDPKAGFCELRFRFKPRHWLRTLTRRRTSRQSNVAPA